MKIAPIETLMKCACIANGISREEIGIKSRKRALVMSRQLVIVYVLANYDNSYSLRDIANVVGKDDHAAIIHARRTYYNLVDIKDKRLLALVESFKSNLKAINSDFSVNMLPPRKIVYNRRNKRIRKNKTL